MTGPDGENVVESSAVRRIESEFEERVCLAFSSGYSVVEIARRIRCKRAVQVYRVLQRRGLIDRSLKKSRYRGPAQLENFLRRSNLSFTKWCNSWRFDPKIAEHELSIPDPPSPSEVHLAARRDFPNLFGTKEGSVDLEEWEREIISATAGYSFRIDWEPRLEKYLGKIKGIETLTITGRRPSVIIMDLVRVAWFLRAIELLDASEKG